MYFKHILMATPEFGHIHINYELYAISRLMHIQVLIAWYLFASILKLKSIVQKHMCSLFLIFLHKKIPVDFLIFWFFDFFFQNNIFPIKIIKMGHIVFGDEIKLNKKLNFCRGNQNRQESFANEIKIRYGLDFLQQTCMFILTSPTKLSRRF